MLCNKEIYMHERQESMHVCTHTHITHHTSTEQLGNATPLLLTFDCSNANTKMSGHLFIGTLNASYTVW